MLIKNGLNMFNKLLEFIEESESIIIYVPYIKLNSLNSLIKNQTNIKSIIVKWEPKDLLLGSSDIAVYPYLKERDITLFRNPRIHLKAFLDSGRRAFIGSANISQRALNIPEFNNYNYEIATIVDDLTFEDRLYFDFIKAESLLITDNIYEQIKTQLLSLSLLSTSNQDFKFKIEFPDKDFLISSLPLSYDLQIIYSNYLNQTSKNENDLKAITHDLALYNIPLGLDIENLKVLLKFNFFNHPFIERFLKNLDKNDEIYFGEAKDWIHKNCSNVPLPRKWEIKESIQTLFKWIVDLSDGIYESDRPNYSQRLFRFK